MMVTCLDASILSSSLRELFRLTIPTRNAEDPEFSAFVDQIGDGAGPNVDLRFLPECSTTNDLIDFVFSGTTVIDPMSAVRQSILAVTNGQTDHCNSVILDRLPAAARTYLAADSLKEADDAGMILPKSVLDYVARRSTPPGLLHHTLTTKCGAVMHIMRNMSLDRGLLKNTRVVVVDIGQLIITVKRLLPTLNGHGDVASDCILILRIPFHHELHSGHTSLRRQFPLAVAYAMMFNGCQGLTLDRAGVDLCRPVFSHSQSYTALSRIRHRRHCLLRYIFVPIISV